MNKSALLTLGIIFGLCGGGASYAAGRVQCFLGSCILATEGSSTFSYRGPRIDSGTAQLIVSAPTPLFGLGGCFLVAGLVKSNSTEEKSK
jgi:hypothetical protein